MIYGVYKNARNASWQCLLDYKINCLPIKVSDIAKQASIVILKNSVVNKLKDNEHGLTIWQNGKFYIIYRDTNPSYRCRFTIAHELGHIFLGHLMINTPMYRTFAIRDDNENAANVFARDLLAPACVLHELGITKADDIAKLCNIGITAAGYRSERMKVLEARNAWYIHPLERQVYKLFENFIKEYRSENGPL